METKFHVRCQYQGRDLFKDCQVSLECTVEKLLDLVFQRDLFIPDSVTLWWEGVEMKDRKQKLSTLEIGENSIIIVKGTYFPLVVFRSSDPPCSICVEPGKFNIEKFS